jgi:hypothetical protein
LADDFELLVGLRSTIASYIRDYGYRCPEVRRIDWLGTKDAGSVMRVVCSSPGSAPETVFRVTAYVEGDFTAHPWREAP